ncbi:MAG: PD-(D/E)XK nuclease family protein [Thermodesulfobacteriota bacterium]
MSKYYNSKRTRNLYDPSSKNPFKLSRSKIELFMECQRCFYIDRRLGVNRPPGFPFTLNSAVDNLLKNEFDYYRLKKQQHPIQIEYNIDAIPAEHTDLDKWRYNFEGIQYQHMATNFIVFGAIDDLWINSKDEYIIVDYKSTSTNDKIVSLDKAWHDSYKRQIEIYQWLLMKNGYNVSEVSYFVYCNGLKDRNEFGKKLDFDVTLITYNGNFEWVEEVIFKAFECLQSVNIPEIIPTCDYCSYIQSIGGITDHSS